MKKANVEKALEIYRAKVAEYTRLAVLNEAVGDNETAIRYQYLASAYSNAATILENAIHGNVEALREVEANL